MAECLICKTTIGTEQPLTALQISNCPRCGTWVLLNRNRENPTTTDLTWFLDERGQDQILRRSRLSHIVRLGQRNDGRLFGVPIADLPSWGLDDPLPTPAEQLGSFILWLGENQPTYALTAQWLPNEIAAYIGASISLPPEMAIRWLGEQHGVSDLIESPGAGAKLTLRGWQRFHELKRVNTVSRSAFMAMKFGEADVDEALERCFKPAVAAAGFDLRNLAEGQRAGLIDDQMRVALNQAKFVVADLTHGSKGAYWEAGYAEGARKKVIYTCQRETWEGQGGERVHFDTNHLATIVWDASDYADAERRLTAMIRATFPADAEFAT